MFIDRRDAGERLAKLVSADPLVADTSPAQRLVLSIPRGGVVIGHFLANALQCPHEVIVVKKVGYPGHEEYAVGAIAEDGMLFLNETRLNVHNLHVEALKPTIQETQATVEHYIRLLRYGQLLDVRGRLVIVTDDGMATGETMQAAVRWLCALPTLDSPRSILVAVPVGSNQAVRELTPFADRVFCLSAPGNFGAVGLYYDNFSPVTDKEVLRLLSTEITRDNT